MKQPSGYFFEVPMTAPQRTARAHEWWELRRAIGECHKQGFHYAAGVLRLQLEFLSDLFIHEHR